MLAPLRAVSLAVLVLSVPGCLLDGAGQTSDGSIELDATTSPDAGRTDGGRDAMPPGDSGPRPDDAGPEPDDAGPEPFDAGPEPIDAGPEPIDAGPPRRDAGPPDAGPLPTCAELFPTTHLCMRYDDRCDLFVMLTGGTGNASCDAFCAGQGSDCVEASVPNNTAGGKCTANGDYGCDEMTETHAICVCRRVYPPPP